MAKRGQSLRKARSRGRPAKPAVDLKQEIAALRRELAQEREQRAATGEALNATADVLKIISRSTFDLQTVLETLAESAARLCEAETATIWRPNGRAYHVATTYRTTPAHKDYLADLSIEPGRGSCVGRTLFEGKIVHIPDIREDPEYTLDFIGALESVRTMLGVPLLREGIPIGVMALIRSRVQPFTDKQIELVTTFADQAVIAIENARLFDEVQARTRDLSESLEQQTATSEVLQVISSSPGELEPVFETMLANAARLCEAKFGALNLYDGDVFQNVAQHNAPPGFAAARLGQLFRPHPGGGLARVARTKQVVHIPDFRTEPAYLDGDPAVVALVEIAGARTVLVVPMLKENVLIGAITIYRQEVRPFTDKQIELVNNFARQAVIAIENTRLLTEQREALERQTATAEVLQVINASPGDLTPVFDAILEKAHRLCAVAHGALQLYDGEKFRAVAVHGLSEAFADRLRQSFVLGPNMPSGRLLEGARFAQADIAEIDDPIARAAAELSGIRTTLAIPLRKDGTLLGTIVAARREVKPFTEKEIALLESFAAQAVIAMENARLLEEIRHRNDELAEALEFQTATGEVLRIVASSPDHLQPVFEAMLEKATELCEAKFGALFLYDGQTFTVAADRNLPPAYAEAIRGKPFSPETNTALRHLITAKTPVQIREMFGDAAYAAREPLRMAAVELAGVRSLVGVPLLKKGELIGFFSIYRDEPGGFAENQIALITTFADQAVIAIENARLFGELRQRTADLARSVDELTATGDVLKIISRSSVELETVLQTLVETVARLCRADQAAMFRRRDDRYHVVASRGFSEEAREFILAHPMAPDRGTMAGRVASGRRVAHIPDVLQDPEYTYREGQKIVGHRTLLGVPLLRGDELVGIFAIARTRVDPFAQKEIELAASFADQAVIAIENARLFEELRDRQAELARSVDELTATGDVLKIISRSSVDLETVLETLVGTVARLCRADRASMVRRRDDAYHHIAGYGYSEQEEEFIRTHSLKADRGTVAGRVALERRAVHVPDVLQDSEYAVPAQKVIGYRTALGIPLLREDALIGIFLVTRTRVEPFTSKEIELVQTFADQAVIAIENARLFEELRDRQAELARSVDELTATGDVLKIISRSSVDLETVLDTLVETAARLCRVDQAAMLRRRDSMYHLVASRGLSEEAKEFIRTHPAAADRGTMVGRVALERRVVHIPDIMQDSEHTYREGQKIAGYRTMLGIPLLREETLVGIFTLHRTRVEPFTTKEIELVTTFADQAVIAIENARLFDELRDRQAELRVTFDNMGDGVAMFGADLRLTAWNRNFQEILDLPDAFLAERPSVTQYFRYLADRGEYSADLEAELSRAIEDTKQELRFERTRPDGRVIEVRRNSVPSGGFVVIFSDITERKRAEAAISAARDAAESALRELQTAQASLVHAQKMAALGQLTAGIAHEIKNPLNFVNNFAGLSVELLDELKEASAQAMGALDANKRAEIVETIGMLTSNLEKIAEHGRRADGIVKSMLQHSRGGSGDWQSVDLNALVEEALNLAYHGARAQDQSFNIIMESDLDRNLAPIEVVPQDVMRVFLNLIGNGFYAANMRTHTGEAAFRPVLKVTTRDLGDAVEIGVRDNGIGISPEHREKLFQPFFTTKPTGEGTGLGLSISYEIVTQQHGGTITVESEVGHFTEFTVRLPRRRHPAAAGRLS